MASYEVERPTRGRRSIANILSALMVILYGVFLLLCYQVKMFGEDPPKLLWLTGLLLMFGLAALISGMFRKNIVVFWIAWPFLVCAAVNIAVNLEWGTYGQLWPCYVLIPAVASALTWLFSRAKASHLRVIIISCAAAFACFLASTSVLDWWWALIIGVIALGAIFLVNALTARRGRWDDGDRPQRKKPIDMDNYDPDEKK